MSNSDTYRETILDHWITGIREDYHAFSFFITKVAYPQNHEGCPRVLWRIYAFVKNNPGAHLRRISKELGIALGDIQYQLHQLEATSLIRSRRIGLYKTYYTISISGERNEKISAFLQQETPGDIILYLIENPGATNNQIAHHKGFSAPTINWHMSRLIETGIVSSQRDGRYTKYHLKGNIKDIVDLLKSYHPSVWNKLSFRLAELFVDLALADPYSDLAVVQPSHAALNKEQMKSLPIRNSSVLKAFPPPS